MTTPKIVWDDTPPSGIQWDDGTPPPPPPVSTGTDVARAAISGGTQGAIGVGGQGGDIRNLIARGLHWAAPQTFDDKFTKDFSAPTASFLPVPVRAGLAAINPAMGLNIGPSSQEISDYAAPLLNKIPYANYQPQTGVGQVTQFATSMWPAVVGGGEGTMARLTPRIGPVAAKAVDLTGRTINRAVIPAIGGTIAGNYVDPDDPSSTLHQAAQLGGAVLGGGLVGGARGLLQQTDPKAVANRLVANTINTARMTPEDIERAGAAATPAQGMTFAEALGQPGVGQAAALTRREGTSAERFGAHIGVRSAQAADTLLNFFNDKFGIDPRLAAGDISDVVQAGRKNVGPVFNEAFDQSGVPTSDKLDYLAQNNPTVKEAMRVGLTDAKTAADTAYLRGTAPAPFDPRTHGITGFDPAGDPILGAQPTWRMWHATKMGVDDLLDPFRDKYSGQLDLSTNRARTLADLSSALRDELTSLNPKYKEALAQSSDYLSTRDAFNNGGSATFNKNVKVADFQKMWDGLNDPQKKAFVGGIANQLFDWQQSGNLKQAYGLRADFAKVPSTQQKLAIALGPDNAAALQAHIDVGTKLAKTGRQIAADTGSMTEPLRQAMAIQDNAARAQRLAAMAGAVGHAVHGNVLGAGTSLLGALGYGTKDLMTLGLGMSPAARDEAGRIFAMSPQEGAAFVRNERPQAFTSGFSPGRTLMFAPGGALHWPRSLLGAISAQPDQQQ